MCNTSIIDVNFLNYLFLETINSSLKVRYNVSVKILLRCIGCHGVDVIYFTYISVNVMCVVIAVRTVVYVVFIFACYVGCGGLSTHNCLLG